MAQRINDNFNLLAGLPVEVDDRHQTISGRDNIPSTKRYTGRLCYVEQTQTLYMLVGGILNENWQPISGKTGVNDVSIYLVENYPFLWQKGRSDAGVDNENNVMEAGDIIMLGYCDYDDGSGSKNTLVRLAKYVSGDATSISSYNVLIYDTTGVSNFKNDVRLPNISEDNATTKLAVLDSDNKLAYVTELPSSLLPPIAISKKVVATETTIASFAANSGNYTFEQGDTIILDSGNGGFYIFFGGAKTDVNSYTAMSSAEVDWSQVVNVPTDVTHPDLDYVLKNGSDSLEDIAVGRLRTDDNLVIKPSNGQMTGSAGHNSIGFFVNNVLFLKHVDSQLALRVSFNDITASRDISVQDFGGKIPLLSSTDVNDGDFEINGALAAQNLVLKAIAEDNAATKILVIDALGNTKYIDKSSIGGNFVTLDTVQTITSRKTFDVTTENPDTGIIINNDRVFSRGFIVNNNGGASRGVTIYNNAEGSSAGIYIINNKARAIEIVNNQGSQSAINIDVNASTGIILNTKQISTKAIRLNRDNGGGGIEIIDNNTSLSGASIYVNNKSNNDAITVVSSDGSQGDAFRLSKFVSGGTTEDRFKIDSEGNTTTQQLKIEDVSENLTAPKIAVLDNDGNVGYIDKSIIGSQLTNVDAATVDGKDIDDYLPLTGGTLTDDLVITKSVAEGVGGSLKLINSVDSSAVGHSTSIEFLTGANSDDGLRILSEATNQYGNKPKLIIQKKDNDSNFSDLYTFENNGDFKAPKTITDVLQLTPRTQPSSPTRGMVYYDSVSNVIRMYNGTIWRTISFL